MIRFAQLGGWIIGIYCNDRLIGQAVAKPGGSAKLFEPVSEALEDEIRTALNERDGADDPLRIVVHHRTDPRREKRHVFKRESTGVDQATDRKEDD